MANVNENSTLKLIEIQRTDSTDFDVIIIGSGPAGVSSAFPLIESGLRVLMVDGGKGEGINPPKGQFLDLRRNNQDQWHWMIGKNFHAIRKIDTVSPKLRVPTYSEVFNQFGEANNIDADNFTAIGSIARGGLSNAWGCGVACLTAEEMAEYPITPEEMNKSYDIVVSRMGVSGGQSDDLSAYYGLDAWSQAPVPLDKIQGSLLDRYSKKKDSLLMNGFRMGSSRVAALTEPKAGRKACNSCGNCLWGCDRHSLYSATQDLDSLIEFDNFHYESGVIVDQIESEGKLVSVHGKSLNTRKLYRAKRVLLAAGTLASTRLALQTIDYREPVPMQSSPTAAFMLWSPHHLGRAHDATFGLGQLSFLLNFKDGTTGFGSLFNTTGIPLTEFARYVPFGKRFGVDLLTSLSSSCIVGNIFLPGNLTDTSLQLNANNGLSVKGTYHDKVNPLMREAQRSLASNFRRLGAVLIPASFKIGRPGSDIHYAASLPMRWDPEIGQTDRYGALTGAKGIHLVDGSCLSNLPEKPHTLVIMANADRIARHIAKTWNLEN